ncbi:hypothetical protein V1477_002042 [Vespula maculifrons]|uniref:Uncharacterized protein n=1 Tax=Vespula maculifrons TaxID=7453 RepID=A0ABD2CY74_VESMC
MTLSASQLVSTRSSNKKQRARTIEDYDEGISIITIGNPPGLHQQRNVLHHHLTAGYHGSHNFIQERDQGILFRRLLPSSKYGMSERGWGWVKRDKGWGRKGNAKEDATKKVSVRETIARSCAPINTRMINFCNASVTPTPPSSHLLHAPFMGLDASPSQSLLSEPDDEHSSEQNRKTNGTYELTVLPDVLDKFILDGREPSLQFLRGSILHPRFVLPDTRKRGNKSIDFV